MKSNIALLTFVAALTFPTGAQALEPTLCASDSFEGLPRGTVFHVHGTHEGRLDFISHNEMISELGPYTKTISCSFWHIGELTAGDWTLVEKIHHNPMVELPTTFVLYQDGA